MRILRLKWELIWLGLFWLFIIGGPVLRAGNLPQEKKSNDLLFQSAPATELVERHYEGTLTMDELLKHGTLGLGTFDAYNGELILLDGTVYRIKAEDGLAYQVPGNETTPFAVVTHFQPDIVETLEKTIDFTQLTQYLDRLLPTKKLFYAIRVEGGFRHIKTRSLYKQEKPYPELTRVLQSQANFEYAEIEGTLVGFWLPVYTESLSTEGYHFHFLSKDKKRGGHVVEFQTSGRPLKIEIDIISNFQLRMPYR